MGALVEKEGIRLYDEIAKEFKDWKAPKPLPTIPQFVADAIEEIKKANLSLYTLISEGYTVEYDDWFDENVKTNSESVARAWLDGYTIEVEKKSVIRVRDSFPSSYLWLNKSTGKIFFESFDYTPSTDKNIVVKEFTNKEIAKISEGAFVDNKAFEKEEVIE